MLSTDPATIARFCIAPVMPACGEGASVSNATCTEARAYCATRGLAPPTCRAETPTDEAWRRGFVTNLHADQPLSALDRVGGECEETPCSMCQGDCDDDSDCAGNLRCFERDNLALTPPGCSKQIDGEATVDSNDDFCYDPNYVHPDRITVRSRQPPGLSRPIASG